ncbi:hypothetical protein L6164_024124 [Bauhinia variegata]|uniref:Uncharacterized protein n=1 Tax=Bauhinia variegata TaxID=167791 RepID=A0ACB9LY30_BAUVA|nr:hypothetical protein L6164_024124 [Bauhinia variegata]
MDRGFRFLCLAETRRSLLVLGITFTLVVVVLNSELPYSKVLSSLFFSVGKISSFPAQTSSVNSKLEGNSTQPYGSNSAHAFDEIASSPETSQLDLNRSSMVRYSRDSITAPASEPAPEKVRKPEQAALVRNFTTKEDTSPAKTVQMEDNDLTSPGIAPSSVAPLPVVPLPNRTSLDSETNSTIPAISVLSNATPLNSDKTDMPRPLEGNYSRFSNAKPIKGKMSRKAPSKVITFSEMNVLLQQNHAPSQAVKPRRSSAVDQEILHAKSEIENAPIITDDSRLYSPLYRNVSMFKRSYELMEKMLKVYIYQDGDNRFFHQYLLDGIYASEGWFMKILEASKQFVTKNPGKAHLFYIPFSSRLLQQTLYVRNSHKRSNLIEYMKNYVDMIAGKYPFWNRTDGADHFVVACHDWAPAETRGRMLNCIRALCNADIEVGFKIGKDVSLPETYVVSAENPLKNVGGNPPSQRPILAFFAGGLHGYFRPILLNYWENKDPDMKITGPLPHVRGNANYLQLMKSSKYCICARGHEVNSPRVVEAIFLECIPVIISDNFIPPFFEVLNWESFAVFVLEKDIPKLKDILLSISEEKYLEMHKRVKKAFPNKTFITTSSLGNSSTCIIHYSDVGREIHSEAEKDKADDELQMRGQSKSKGESDL